MSQLLDVLRQEAAQLVEQDLPSSEELRPIVAAAVNRLQALEEKVFGEVQPAAEPAAAPEPPTPLQQAEQELQAAQAKVAALQAQNDPAAG